MPIPFLITTLLGAIDVAISKSHFCDSTFGANDIRLPISPHVCQVIFYGSVPALIAIVAPRPSTEL